MFGSRLARPRGMHEGDTAMAAGRCRRPVERFNDLLQSQTDFTPGLSYATTLDRMSLRGVGRLTSNHGSDPGIATYSDGFYTASNVEAGKRPIPTDRVEVLRGPNSCFRIVGGHIA